MIVVKLKGNATDVYNAMRSARPDASPADVWTWSQQLATMGPMPLLVPTPTTTRALAGVAGAMPGRTYITKPLVLPIEKAGGNRPAPAAGTGLTAKDVRKMIDTAQKSTVEKLATLESTIAEQGATIEKQRADLRALAAQPLGGGPVTRFVPGVHVS